MTHDNSPASETEKQRILVFGDAMIDRTWVVAEPADTSQPHAEVRPQKVAVERNALANVPGQPTGWCAWARPGGAGLTAEWLAWSGKQEVSLLAPVGSELAKLLKQGRVTVLDERQERSDTTKFRIYAQQGSRHPPLRHRFDLDLPPEPDFRIPEDLNQHDAVVVADFMKGTVTHNRIDELVNRCKQAWWLVDSKNPELVAFPAWKLLVKRPTLFVNRSEFSAICSVHLREQNPLKRVDLSKGEWRHIEGPLLNAAAAFRQALGHWDLVVKLDSEGAAAFWLEGNTWYFARATAPPVDNATAIGAGDAFAAGWTSALMEGAAPTRRLAESVRYASAWVHETERAARLSRPMDIEPPKPEQPGWHRIDAPAAIAVDDKVNQLAEAATYSSLVSDGKVVLSHASGVCGRFMAVDFELRTAVLTFAEEIRSYFATKEARHPLNCLVWASPGSGKSFLVEEVARHVNVIFREINVATMANIAELKTKLLEASSSDEKAMLIMVDEFMAKVGGEHIFPSLLVPLWSTPRTKKLAFVLVDSFQGKDIQSAHSFAEYIASIKGSKGADLVSRLNGPLLSLTKPGALDRVYLVASLLRRIHPDAVYEVEADALRALAGVDQPDSQAWSPRAVEYIVQAVRPKGGVLRYKDLSQLHKLCERLKYPLIDRKQIDERPIGTLDK